MIELKDKKDCCGCGACVQVCPKQCICMSADDEGFLYPKVENSICIDCGLCEKVCPVINQNEQREPLAVYAAKNTNEEIRLKSSSGGIFTLLAEQIIAEGGVVFGAKFNEKWEVVHDYTETIDGLEAFRGSKYVQSVIGDNFSKTKQFLIEGRKVLFSGTPCQIAGLQKYLRKNYDNLQTIDIVCHGVPSPLVWSSYLDETCRSSLHQNVIKNKILEDKQSLISNIKFRDKASGWENYSFRLQFTNESEILQIYRDNIYMRVFLTDLCNRPSCMNCPAKKGKSGSDITIADYWGIEKYYPIFDDDKGVSLVLINSREGLNIFNKIETDKIETSYIEAVAYNRALEDNIIENKYIKKFWRIFSAYGFNNKKIEKILSSTISIKVRCKMLFRKAIISVLSESSFVLIRSKLIR